MDELDPSTLSRWLQVSAGGAKAERKLWDSLNLLGIAGPESGVADSTRGTLCPELRLPG